MGVTLVRLTEFTVWVVLGRWCGCYIGQSLQCGYVWLWGGGGGMSAMLVKIYIADVCDSG